MASGERTRVVLAVASTLFIVHNLVFVMLAIRQFKEETLLRLQYQQQLDRVEQLRSKCPKMKIQETAWHGIRGKRQTDAMFQQMITEQELILERHCGNGTGFCVKGDKGEQGLKGESGPKGQIGLVGNQGPVGDNGTEGLQGPGGVNGTHGDTGAKGLRGQRGQGGLKGDRGPTGTQGGNGTKGIPGQDGPQGKQGDIGEPGLTGPVGLKGDHGLPGIKGINGTPGVMGEKGSRGADGVTPYFNPNCTCAVTPSLIGPAHENIVGTLQSSIVLNCSVTGSPPPKVTWTKEGARLPSGSIQQGTLLTIPSAHALDGGNYKCHADNGLGAVEKTFKVSFVYLNCDFERDFCSWTQNTNDNKDWTYYSGGTPTSNTGPSGDHTTGSGHYVYLETSLGRERDKAELSSPFLGSGTNRCLQFWYHMFGVDINSLTIYLEFPDGSRSQLWTRGGSQGNQWQQAVINIPAQSQTYKIVIQSQRGKSIEGDIGLDDILVNDGDCPLKAQDLNCNFERDLCFWTQSKSDKFDLIRQSGGTLTTSTGPTADHTLKNVAGHYVYLESSSGSSGDKATIISPMVKVDSDMCFSVFYHMYGSGMGTLHIYTQMAGSSRELTWTRSGPQGTGWREARFTVPQSSRPFHLIMETIKGKNSYSDIAIDDIKAVPQACGATYDLGCDFESSLCRWSQGTTDNFDWRRRDGPVPGKIGPSVDHTLQTAHGHYVYIDPSYPNSQTSDLKSPPLSPNIIYCLHLWYFMDGTSDIGQIRIVRAQFNVDTETLKTISVSAGSGWHELKLNVPSFWANSNLLVRGVRGHNTDSIIAVDDIDLTTGICKN